MSKESKRDHPRSFLDFQEIYNTIYSHRDVVHPTKGLMGNYGDVSKRDVHFVNFIKEKVSAGGLILDASCGRGHLIRLILEAGYVCEGTEIASILFDTDLADFNVKLLGYHQLKELGSERYDAVCSSDVLEHLPDVAAIRIALENLCYISKRYVLISTGTVYGTNYPQAIEAVGKKISDLHCVTKDAAWWRQKVSEFVNIEWTYKNRRVCYMFGDKK